MNDTRSPYSPPNADVASVEKARAEAKGPRPTAINVALLLIVAEILFLIAHVISSRKVGGPVALLLGGIDAAITLVLCVAIARGRNWARIVFFMLWLISASWLALLFSVIEWPVEGMQYRVDWPRIVTLVVPSILSLVTVILLFGPGRGWFRGHEAAD